MAGSDILGEIGKGELLREEELNTAGGRFLVSHKEPLYKLLNAILYNVHSLAYIYAYTYSFNTFFHLG